MTSIWKWIILKYYSYHRYMYYNDLNENFKRMICIKSNIYVLQHLWLYPQFLYEIEHLCIVDCKTKFVTSKFFTLSLCKIIVIPSRTNIPPKTSSIRWIHRNGVKKLSYFLMLQIYGASDLKILFYLFL